MAVYKYIMNILQLLQSGGSTQGRFRVWVSGVWGLDWAVSSKGLVGKAFCQHLRGEPTATRLTSARSLCQFDREIW